MHLSREREGRRHPRIPYDTVAQAVLTPLAFTKGIDFKRAQRPDPDEVTHWDTW